MEALSPTMEEGRVVKWHKRDGDPVKAGETLAEVETDKAVMDLVARADGELRQVAAAAGQCPPPLRRLSSRIPHPASRIPPLAALRTMTFRSPRSARRSRSGSRRRWAPFLISS